MLANLNLLSIKRGRASRPVEVLEYRMGFASGPKVNLIWESHRGGD